MNWGFQWVAVGLAPMREREREMPGLLGVNNAGGREKGLLRTRYKTKPGELRN